MKDRADEELTFDIAVQVEIRRSTDRNKSCSARALRSKQPQSHDLASI